MRLGQGASLRTLAQKGPGLHVIIRLTPVHSSTFTAPGLTKPGTQHWMIEIRYTGMIALHVATPTDANYPIVASNIGRIGKKADEDDMRVINRPASSPRPDGPGQSGPRLGEAYCGCWRRPTGASINEASNVSVIVGVKVPGSRIVFFQWIEADLSRGES